MGKLKDLLLEIEEEAAFDDDDDAIEVYADSVKQALELAAEELNADIATLDYHILEKGTSGFFGLGRQPYRVLIRVLEINAEHDDLDELERKLASDHMPGVKPPEKKDADSTFKIRVQKSGVMLTVIPPRGKGKKLDLDEVNNKLYSMRITTADMNIIEKEINKPSGEPVKIDNWKPNPDFDSTMYVEVTEDEMRAYVHINPPRFSGRHLDYEEIMSALKDAGVISGIKEDRIKQYLDEMNYSQPLLAAEGTEPRHGNDAYIDYKVRVETEKVTYEEDESGRVDFKNLELLENVVVGQVLAVKVPAEEGVPGRTVTNQLLQAKSGKDVKFSHGSGTILSEDGTELTAEINGQVVFKGNKITVEPVHYVKGDVSLETGNIIFLGSVVVSGNVQDNFTVKAAGNIEVKGSVQKAFLEAEGDIVIRQGISGREEAKIESTGGSVFAKFVTGATIIAEKLVSVPEGIVQSRVDAGERVLCFGKKARIVGGVTRAGDEINARSIGSDVSTKTELWVGINPKVLQQIADLESMKNEIDEELGEIRLNLKTLEAQKRGGGKFSEEKEKTFQEMTSKNEKLTARIDEINLELEELREYTGMLERKGKICAEKTAYSGVEMHIIDEYYPLRDNYNHAKFHLEGGRFKISAYEPPDEKDEKGKITTVIRKR